MYNKTKNWKIIFFNPLDKWTEKETRCFINKKTTV